MSASGPWWAGRAGPSAPAGGVGGGAPARAVATPPPRAPPPPRPGGRAAPAPPPPRGRSRGEDARLPAAARRILGLFGLGAVAALLMARALAGLGGVPAGLASNEAEGRVVVRLTADPESRWATARVLARLESTGGRAGR